MSTSNSIQFRRAQQDDVFPIMRLYQIAKPQEATSDPILNDYQGLSHSIQSNETVWIVTERGGETLAVLSVLVEHEHRLCKLNRMYLDPSVQNSERVLKDTLLFLIDFLKKEISAEVLYTTTRTLSLKQQELTLDLGFKILGIFPNATGADHNRLNGLTVYFFDEVLANKRYADYTLHPLLSSFYEIARQECGLAPLPSAEIPDLSPIEFEPLPTLEMIHAPEFVHRKFTQLKERKSHSIHFYPFQDPNTLITDPEEKVTLFVRLIPEHRFATLIGERLEVPVSPVELYTKVSLMLKKMNVSYIEVITDASDAFGIECIANAGYLPTAYFFCLKSQGDTRRDYVAFSRSFEKVNFTDPASLQVNPRYIEYLREYYRLEEERFFHNLKPRFTVPKFPGTSPKLVTP